MPVHIPILFLLLFPIHKERITENFSVSVYPNPNSGIFQVEVRGATKEMNLRLYNMMGELSQEYRMSNLPVSTTFTIGKESLNPGIYKLIVMCNNGEQMIKKILIE